MSFSILGAFIAVGGVIGGVVMGVAKGPAYYRMFDVVIMLFTCAGLLPINTRHVVWGRHVTPRDGRVRAWFSGGVVLVSLALAVAQLASTSP